MIELFRAIELYTYSEEPEFVWNAEAFNILFQAKCKIRGWVFSPTRFDALGPENKKWKEYSRDEKIDFIIYLLEQCELVDRTRRCQAMRAILYLVQGNEQRRDDHRHTSSSFMLGVFYQCADTDEYMINAKENVLLLYTCDGVHMFVDLFNMELNQ